MADETPGDGTARPCTWRYQRRLSIPSACPRALSDGPPKTTARPRCRRLGRKDAGCDGDRSQAAYLPLGLGKTGSIYVYRQHRQDGGPQ
jgi:hypothetical protein